MNLFSQRARAVVAVAAMAAVSGCASLDIENPNAPDRSRALAQSADVSSLVGGGFYNWYFATQYMPPSLTTSAMALHTSMSWGNFGSRKYSSTPRVSFNNISTDPDIDVVNNPWYSNYGALVAANLALLQVEDENVFGEGTEDMAAMVKNAAQFLQGASLANIALFFNQGYAVDETTNPVGVTFTSRQAVRDMALAKLDLAIASAAAGGWDNLPGTYFNLPSGWTPTQLAQVANTQAARLMIYFPRTSAEQAAMTPADWAKIASYASKGISTGTPFSPSIGGNNDTWYDGLKIYIGEWDTWQRVNQRVVNELDPSQPIVYPVDGSTPPVPNSPDARFDPTVRSDVSAGAQVTDDFLVVDFDRFNPARGRYHFSRVVYNRYAYHGFNAADGGGLGVVPWLIPAENDLIWAEALIRQGGAGNLAAAAALINKSRVGRGGLAALTGTAADLAITTGLAPRYNNYDYNTSDATARILLRAIFYERDIELMASSAITPFYDARRTDRWDNLSAMNATFPATNQWPGGATALVRTPHEFPVPAKELETLGMGDQLYTIAGKDSVKGGASSSLRVRIGNAIVTGAAPAYRINGLRKSTGLKINPLY